MKKYVELIPLAEIGHGYANVTDDSIEIEVGGINGSMKAWLIGGEAVPIGNIVNGKLHRKIDTRHRIGILVTQGGRQMLIGKFSPNAESTEDVVENKKEETVPFEFSGFEWKKFSEKSFSNLSPALRFILSNREVYENYKKHRHYWVGESETTGALALKCENSDTDPLSFTGNLKIRKDGYIIVCIDKETGKICIPKM